MAIIATLRQASGRWRSLATASARVVAAFLTLATMALATRRMSREEFGFWAICFAVHFLAISVKKNAITAKSGLIWPKLLSREIATCLRGRALTTEVFPLSFREYGTFHGLAMPANGSFGASTRSRILQALDLYLHGGGFPGVQDMAPEMRQEVLQNYVDVVLLRDVIERHGISNVPALRALTRHLLQNPATGFSVTCFHGQLQSCNTWFKRVGLSNNHRPGNVKFEP